MHRGDCARAQCHGQVGGVFVGVKTKAGEPVLRITRPHGLQDADGNHVFRLRQCAAQRHRAFKRAVVVFGLPGLAAGGAAVEEQGGVIDDGGGCEAFFQRRRVDEGLEAGARLAPGLCDVVELVLAEVKATHQRLDGTTARVHGHKSPFHFRQLGSFPGVFHGFGNTDDRTTPQLDVGRGFVAQAGLYGFEAVTSNVDGLAITAHNHQLLGTGFQHHSGHQVAVVRVLQQHIVDGFVHLFRVGRQGNEFFRAPVNLAAFVVHDAAAQRLVSGLLVGRIQRGVHVQATGVNLGAVLRINQLAYHFCNIFGMDACAVGARADDQFFRLGFCGLLGGDKANVFHALDDVELARPGAAGVGDRVVGRRCLGQTRQHGGFGNTDVFQRFAKIGFRRCGKTIGAVAQVDLVHVDLKNLVLGQHVLQLECQQHFVNLATERSFGRKIDVACHLHGDGGGSLAFQTANVGQTSAHHAFVVHPTVLVKTGVFNGKYGIFHDRRNVLDRRQIAPFLAKLSQQRTFG